MINKYIKKIPKILKDYVKTNNLFFIFFISSLINSIILRILTVGNFLTIDPILADTTIILLIGSIGFLLSEKKQYRYWLICSIVFTIICVCNSMYYTFYTSFASVSLLSTSVFIDFFINDLYIIIINIGCHI